MSLEWIAPLAASGGAALAAALGTDAWRFTRDSLARLFGRKEPSRAALVERRLDDAAAEIAEADDADLPAVRARQQAAWEVRLTDLLEEDPTTADDLAALIAEVKAQLPANHWTMNITASAPNATAQGVQNGSIINHY